MTVVNEIGVTRFTTPSDREIMMTRVVAAPRRLVFAAYTDPRHVPNWMRGPDGWTMPVCEIDLRPGGAWRFVWRGVDGAELAMRGVYREVVPPERLVNTESWGAEWPETLNTVVFAEQEGRTTITTTVRYPSTAARDAALRTGMKDGMSMSFDRLAAYLRTMA